MLGFLYDTLTITRSILALLCLPGPCVSLHTRLVPDKKSAEFHRLVGFHKARTYNLIFLQR